MDRRRSDGRGGSGAEGWSNTGGRAGSPEKPDLRPSVFSRLDNKVCI